MRNLLWIPLVFWMGLNMLSAQSEIMDSEAKPLIPLDDIVERTVMKEKRILAYPAIREADIFWEKRIWRVIDTREKMNLSFRYEKMPLFSIMLDGIKNGELTAYSIEDDQFSYQLSQEELSLKLYQTDTIERIDPETMVSEYQVISNDMDPQDIKRYRLKEVWFFDSKYSTLRVRILGIAPLKEVYDENGNFRYEQPLFWIHYPQSREFLAQYPVFNSFNDNGQMTWEDLFEMRFFSSYITKESNLFDRKLEHYLSGKDLLLESEKIKMKIFNFEHDLWSY